MNRMKVEVLVPCHALVLVLLCRVCPGTCTAECNGIGALVLHDSIVLLNSRKCYVQFCQYMHWYLYWYWS